MKIPRTVAPMIRPKVSDTDALMAAAEMHEMGRLIQRDEMAYDVIEEKFNNPEAADVIKQYDGLMEHADPNTRKYWNQRGLKDWEDKMRWEREHPKRNQHNKPMIRDRA